MLSEDASASTAATNDITSSVPLDLGSLDTKKTECFPHFKCIHVDFPGKDILHAALAKYRKKPNMLAMVNAAQDFYASYESLEEPLFYSDRDNVRLINVGIYKYGVPRHVCRNPGCL